MSSKKSHVSLKADSASLTLDFVYGYQGSRNRDNLVYTASGEILYHIAAVGVLYNPSTHTQRHFLYHTDDITSLTLHPNKKFCATGQIGKEPFVVIWDTTNCQTISLCKGFHQRGISSLGFSNDGTYLVSCGQDDNHTIAIWEWKKGRVIANANSSKDQVFDIQLSPYSNTIVTCGVKHIKFWTYSGNSLVAKAGIHGKVGEIQTYLCVFFGHNDGLTYTGTLNGDIYIWKDTTLSVNVAKAHKGPVYVVTTFPDGFLSGGKDGVVKAWGKDFKPLHSIPIGHFATEPTVVPYNIRALCFDESRGGGRFLVGTKTSDILEVAYSRSKPKESQVTLLIEGHGDGELWGLAVHPSGAQFITASDDKTVKLWDAKAKRCLYTIQTKYEARSCGYSPNGDLFAVGFMNGSFTVYDAKDPGKEVASKKDRKEQISVIKFSPNGKYLGVASHDNFVDIYATGTFKKIGTLTRNSSFITHFDWSEDSATIRTNSGDYQTMYYSIAACQQAHSGAGIQWATLTTVLDKDVAGIWPPYSDKTDVNSLDKSKQGDLLATGDDFGTVKLFGYPALKGAKAKAFIGHSAHVTSVRFLNDSSALISTGGGDQAVFQWRVVDSSGAGATESFDDDVFDHDLMRENNANYSRPQLHSEDTVKSGMLIHIEEDEPAVMAGNPSLNGPPAPTAAAKQSNGPSAVAALQQTSSRKAQMKERAGDLHSRPKDGESRSGHVDRLPAPEGQLQLEFVYGYRGWDCRNNVVYNADGDVVYHVAAAGLVLNPRTLEQRQLVGQHNDDILALALRSDRKLVATGEIGPKPRIVVWDSSTLQTQAVLSGFHTTGIAALAFQPDQPGVSRPEDEAQLLVSVGLDEQHSIAVWDWNDGIKLADTRGSTDRIFTADFNPNAGYENQFVTCGIKHVVFWRVAGNGLVSTPGKFGSVGKAQTMLSAVFDKSSAYTASAEGQIYRWSFDASLQSVIQTTHSGPILSLFGGFGRLATGGKDGKLNLYGPGFKLQNTIDLSNTTYGAPIRSVALDGQGRVLLATQDGGLFEADEQSGQVKVLLRAHGEGDVYALATHPSLSRFVTAGDDKKVFVWDAGSHALLHTHVSKKAVRSVAYSPDGGLIALGHVGGRVSLLDANSFEEVWESRALEDTVNVVQFSPLPRDRDPSTATVYLAAGANVVDLFAVPPPAARQNIQSAVKPVGRCLTPNPVTHIDFTVDADLICVNTAHKELLYFSVPKGSQLTPTKSAAAKFEYATRTCIVGEDLAGIMTGFSNAISLDRSKDETPFAAVGARFGKVKLFDYLPADHPLGPGIPLGAHPREFPGHAAFVNNVRFLYNDSHLITVGGDDTAVFQWKFTDPDDLVEDDDVSGEELYDSDIERETKMVYVPKVEAMQNAYAAPPPPARDAEGGGGLFQLAGDESMFAGNSHTQMNEHENDHGKVDNKSGINVSLELEYIHGYRSRDARNNLWYTDGGRIVYHVAGVGVVLDPANNTQKFFLEHTDDIVSLARHPTKPNIVATGQVGKTPEIIVWDTVKLKSLAVLKGAHTNGIGAISFNKSGDLLASVGLDVDHTIAVHRWEKGVKLASVNGDKNLVFDIVANPFVEGEYVSVGVKHIRFWTLAGSALQAKKGVFGKLATIQTLTSAVYSNESTCYTGTVTGEIFEWKGAALSRVIQAHAGPVYSINAGSGGDFFSGAKDGKVLRWDAGFKAVKDTVPVGKGKLTCVRSVTEKDGAILVGTLGSSIIQIVDKKPKLLVSGHSEGELWGLATHPDQNEYVTVSDDKQLKIWSVSSRAAIRTAELPHPARSVAYAPDGRQIAVGFQTGAFAVYDVANLEAPKVKKQARKEDIADIKFSPDGSLLAVGSHDNFVDVYSVDTWKLVGTCKGNSSYITHLDWSKDSKYIHTNSGAYENLMYEVVTGDKPSVRQAVDRKLTAKLNDFTFWATWTSVLGSEVEGVWPPGSDGTDINAVDVMRSGTALVTGDDFGLVKVLAFPCPKKNRDQFKRYTGHSSHVTCVRFTADNAHLVSTGGADQSVFQFKVITQK